MKIEALRTFMLSGEMVKTGEVVEASSVDAMTLINLGKAKEAVVCAVQKQEPAPKAKKTTPKPKKPLPTSDK
jgi:hypothetical protein|tara:strand:+ start:515 stop:730 length:216 start_codon:yes stop_codon:yes gene_type:complete